MVKLVESPPLTEIVIVRSGSGGVRLPDSEIGVLVVTSSSGHSSESEVGTGDTSTVHDGELLRGAFGVGAEITAQVMARAFDDLDAPVARLNGASAPTPYSPPLEAAVVPNTQTITQAIRDLLAE